MNIEISPVEYAKYLTWNDGMLYCQLLEIDDKNDWRLPTIEELNYLLHNKKINEDVYRVYWSSSSIDDIYAMIVDLRFNYQYRHTKSGGIYYVMPIRSL